MVSTAHSYADFQIRLDRIFKKATNEINGFCGYKDEQIVFRLVQRIAQLGIFEFTRLAAKKFRKTGKLFAEDEIIYCAGICIESDGSVHLSWVKFIALFFEFVVHWTYALLVILLALKPLSSKKKISLLYGVGMQDLFVDESDVRFLNFCRYGHILPLASASYLAIQSTQPISSADPLRVKFGRDPLLIALGWTGFGINNWLCALAQHVVSGLIFLRAVSLAPILILLGRDIASDAAARVMSRQNCLGDVVLTTSNYFSQSLWMSALPDKRHTCHMVWYSQNIFPVSYFDETEKVPIPNLRYIKVDIQWVWTKNFMHFLEEICLPCIYKIVPPVVWCLPSVQIIHKKRSPRIILFDITPVNHDSELSFGLLRNFYNEKNMSKFLFDIINATKNFSHRNKIKIEIILKHKRSHQNIHSLEYINNVKMLVNSNEVLLAKNNTNLYDLILESDMVIAAPYSSPVYIARYLGKDAIWYDPTSELDWKFKEIEIPLVKGYVRLVNEINQVFWQNKNDFHGRP